MRCGLIESMRRGYPVALMCRALNVSERGFREDGIHIISFDR